MPIVAKVLPYLNAVAIALQRLAEKIVLLLGFEDFDWGGLGKGGGTTSDALSTIYDETENVSDAMGDATKKAKEYQNQLLGFDEAYKLSEPAEDTSSSATGAGLSGPDTAALDAAFKKIANEYQAAWTAAFEQMEQESTAIADKITGYFNKIYKAAEPLRKSLKNLWNDGFKKLLKFKSDALKDFYNDFLKPLGKWTLGKGLPKLVDALNDFLNKINWNRLRANLSSFWKGIEPFVEGFGEGMIDFFDTMLGFGATAINVLGEAIGAFGDILQKIGADKVKDVGKILGEIVAALLTYKAIKSIITIVKKIGLAFQGLMTAITSASMASVAGIILAISAALYSLIQHNNKIEIEISAEVQEALDSMQAAIDKFEETKSTFEQKISDIDINFDSIQKMSDKYYEMSKNYESLSDEEKALVSFYAKELKESIPEITGFIDEQTGAFKGTKDQLQGIIDKTKEYYKIQAAEEFLKEAYKAQAELNKKRQDSVKIIEEQIEKVEKAGKAYEEYNAQIEKGDNVFQKVANGTGWTSHAKKLKELKTDYYSATTELNELMDSYDALGKTLEQNTSDIEYWETHLTTAYQNQSNSYEEYSKNVQEESINIQNVSKETTQSIVQDSQTMESQVKQSHEGIGRSFGETTSKMQSDSSNTVGRINLWLDKIKVPSLQINTETFNNKVSNSVSGANSNLNNLNTGILQLNTSPFNTNFYNAFNNANNLLTNGLQTAKIDVDTNEAESKVQTFLNTINKSFGNIKLGFSAFGSTMNLPKYAVGGFPEDGLFYANHNELVGQFSNGKTAVANNEQITEGIANAVYRAFVEANINSGANNQRPIIKVYVGNKELGDIAIEEINNRTVSNGKNPLYY